jgi:hypothetical protein
MREPGGTIGARRIQTGPWTMTDPKPHTPQDRVNAHPMHYAKAQQIVAKTIAILEPFLSGRTDGWNATLEKAEKAVQHILEKQEHIS